MEKYAQATACGDNRVGRGPGIPVPLPDQPLLEKIGRIGSTVNRINSRAEQIRSLLFGAVPVNGETGREPSNANEQLSDIAANADEAEVILDQIISRLIGD